MSSPRAQGRGIATAMCSHSLSEALRLGYKAMQFNFVLESNHGALRLWEKLGFRTIGEIPKAFDHPKFGLVNAVIMYKWLLSER
mmetsp:Transcript_33379/g.56572  ORF Transcript_33379/g.56572 Transcript_33379/m.56572 type:complete len:84 (-) Transcript_33379:210-461(-)